MTILRVLCRVRRVVLCSSSDLKLGVKMQGQGKKNTYDAQTRQMWIQVLGNASDSTSRSLLLVTDKKRFLFNCGESTQRDFIQYSTKLLRTEQIFLTSANWRNLGGLSATLLMIDRAHTVRDREVTIHGPESMQYLLTCVQKFVTLKNTDVTFESTEEGVAYTDRSLTIKCGHLRKDNDGVTNQLSENVDVQSDSRDNLSSSREECEIDNNSKRKVSIGGQNEQLLKKQKTLDENGTPKRVTDVFCYVCETNDAPGKLMVEKCIEKGVPTGPLLSMLKSGQDVTLDDGTVVLSKDVCLPPTQGVSVIILECPTEEYIESLINHPMISEHQSSKKEKKLFCIYHFTPETVLQNPEYQAWMKRFREGTHHIILNEKNKRSVIEGTRKLQYKLNLLHPEIFPLFAGESQSTIENEGKEGDPYFHRATPQMKVHIQPTQSFDSTVYPECDPEGYIKEAMSVEGFPEALTELKNKLEASPEFKTGTGVYPRVVFLGTGSALATTVRNVSSVLLRIDEEHNLLLDCGDGTVRQIYTLYGQEKGSKIISKIKGIFVSHMHADHHTGLIGILKEREKLANDRVYLIAPAPLYGFLNHYDKVFDLVCGLFEPVLCTEFLDDDTRTNDRDVYKALNLLGMKTTKVVHTKHSFGILLTLPSGFTIAYSGDTRPCPEMVELARNVDLLLHEATMGADQKSWAISTKHSTVPEALDIVKKSDAKNAILTHVSQKYSKIPITAYEVLPKNVGVACDFMDVSVNMLPLLHDLYRCVHALNDPNANRFTLKQMHDIEFGRQTVVGL